MLTCLLCLAVVLPYGSAGDPLLEKSPLSSCRTDGIPGELSRCASVGSGYVPHGKHCHVKDSSSQSYIVKCSDGEWKVVPTALKRTRRQLTVVFGIAGAGIGAVLGPVGALVGGIIGGVAGFLCDLFCKGSSPPPNTPPSISWSKPKTATYYAKPGDTFVVVKWSSPSASDKEDGGIRPKQTSGQPSNSKFSRGQHTITYRATDSKGLSDYSHYTFKVKVRVCKGSLPNPTNGHITCDNHEKIAGTTCTYHCSTGYQLQGVAQRTCQIDEQFSGVPPTCQIKTCPNSLHLTPGHGRAECNPNRLEYNTVCNTKCDPGYSVPARESSFTTCQSDGQWSKTLSDCTDSEPPTILTCPITQYVYTDRGLDTAVVNWSLPTVKDNSGEIITPTQIEGQEPGTNFVAGTMEIRYSATDSAGNTSPDCIFSIRVEQQICDPPNILDQYLEIDCPGGFSFGSECYLSCRGSYPLIGFDTISCERNTTNPDRVYWDMGTGDVPYCKLNKCPELSPPENGALTCDKWMFGTQCMMHCHEDYDVPAVTGRFIGQFTCSTSSGKWSPAESVPGCTVQRNPQNSYLPGEMYYFTGSCNDTATQQRIKENFIAEMQRLQQNGWDGVCPNTDDCNVDNVDLQCGPARRRRDVHRLSRQAQQASVLVTFNIVVKWGKYGNTTSDAFQYLQKKAKSLGDIIGLKVQSGALNIEGAEVDPTSFNTGRAVIECEPGRYPRYTTLTCASCVLGSFYDADRYECIECPRGSYRDSDDLITCTLCPPSTSTATPGTVNATDCVPPCEPGYYSLTGVAPCTPCTRSQYGPHEMATHCEECGSGLITSSTASTRQSDCSVFDAVISGGMSPEPLGYLPDGTDDFTLALWIKIPLTNDVYLRVEISDVIQIDIGGDVGITLMGARQPTGVELNVGFWQHVAVVYNSLSENVTVFVRGFHRFSFETPLPPTTGDVHISSTGNHEADVYISGLLLTTTPLGDVTSLVSTCYNNETGSVTMDVLKELDSVSLMSPSICDAEDNCDPDPCNGHVCIDAQDGFICRCDGGFSGDTCQIPPDHCYNHLCDNGATCNNLPTNYTCLCATGFNGMFCEHVIVDGGWSSWSDWSSCSQSCDGGNRTRQRECDDPYPDPEGRFCPGESIETGLCSVEACPVCPPRPRSYGTVMDCNVTSGLTTCLAKCRPGLWFVSGYPPLPVYKCGAETGYNWNGRPPSCSEIYLPKKLKTVSVVSYGSVDLCNHQLDMENAVLINSLDNIECAATQTCDVDVTIQGCSSRQKRSTDDGPVQAVVTLGIDIQDINPANNPPSTVDDKIIRNFLRPISALENSTKQLNTSTDILKIEVAGQEYDALGVVSRGTVECRDGQIQLEAVCTDCPQGTYNRDGAECIPCPYGTYQDKVGSTDCKECPDRLSTPFQESIDISDCSVSTPAINVTAPKGPPITAIIVGCTIGLLCLCAVVIGVTLWWCRRRKRHHLNKPAKLECEYKPCVDD